MTTFTETATRVRVTHLTEPCALYRHYPAEQEPQGAYIALDIRTGELWADYNPEIGNAVPMDVWHGIVRRYRLPGVLLSSVVNDLLDRIAPLAERVLAGSEIRWDGSNHVAVQDADAEQAEEEIATLIGDENDYSETDYVAYWDAHDWLDPVASEIRALLRDGATVEELVAEYGGDGTSPDHPIVRGIEEYIAELANSLDA